MRAHQHSSAISESDESIGKSRGGFSTKIHLAVDGYGYPVHVELTGGQRNDFARIKHFRAISTRYNKLERNYASIVSLAFAIMWLPMHG